MFSGVHSCVTSGRIFFCDQIIFQVVSHIFIYLSVDRQVLDIMSFVSLNREVFVFYLRKEIILALHH